MTSRRLEGRGRWESWGWPLASRVANQGKVCLKTWKKIDMIRLMSLVGYHNLCHEICISGSHSS